MVCRFGDVLGWGFFDGVSGCMIVIGFSVVGLGEVVLLFLGSWVLSSMWFGVCSFI